MNEGKTMNNANSVNTQVQPSEDTNLHEIWLAGGCFWGLEAYLGN